MPIYPGNYNGPPNAQKQGWLPPPASKLFVIMHSTEGTGSADDESNYAKRRTDGTSSHYYADGDEVVQSTDTDLSANGVGSTQGNRRGIHYEFCGKASWSRSQWLTNIDWPKAAASIKRDCLEWDIPVRKLSVGQLQDLGKGLTTHNDCRIAFGGTDHTDPGKNFPLDHLIELINGGTPMELDDIKDLANTDGVFPSPRLNPYGEELTPEQIANNPYWTFGGYVRQTAEDLRMARGDIRDVDTALNSRMDAIEARLVQVLEAVAAIPSGGAEADAIVDEMAARLADTPEAE